MLRTLYYAIGIVILLVILYGVCNDRKQKSQACRFPCDTCKYLLEKGGHWRYTCNPPHRIIRHFDKPPSYCAYYMSREDAKDEEM